MAAAVSGCRLWIDVDHPQCERDQTCVSLFGNGSTCGKDGVCAVPSQTGTTTGSVRAIPGRWACARTPAEPVSLQSSRSVRVRMDVVDATTLQGVKGLSGAVCLADDVDCEQPLVLGIVPGDDGYLELELPYGFQGFFSLEAPGYIPSLAYNNRPYIEPTTTRGPPMVSESALETIAAASGGDVDDSEHGQAFLEIRDCDDKAGDGIRFDPVDERMPFYFEGALPSPDLSETAISNQLSAGREPRAVVGFTDLEPGSTTFQAVLPASGDVVSRVTVEIRAGHITYVRMLAGY